MNKDIHVPYAKTVYGQKEIDAVVKCLNESTQMGKYTSKFEKKISLLFSKKNSLFVNSGSSALYIGMEAKGYKPGSEVITPALTFSTSVGCIVKSDLIPVFVDVSKRDYCIDVEKIEEVISDKTVAILAPNLLGNLCKWDEIHDIAKKYNLDIIEDSADTLGGTLHGKPSGYWSDWSITSFYGSHIINCAGNGGMLCMNDPQQIKQAKLLRSWGRASSIFDEKSEAIENRFNLHLDDIEYDAKFVFERIGYNLEGSEIGAAFGLVQLDDLDKNIEVRNHNFNKQTEFFSNYSDYFELPEQTPGAHTAWLAYPIIIKETSPFKRRNFQIFLEKNNIQTRTIFTGNITKQPGFANISMRKSPAGFTNADNVMRGGVLLACHHGMSSEMFSHMHNVIDDFISKNT
ncbi:MAG: aminotransferase class I/II-fold pyridoxal phosphate-dependent enzyme [Legionellales bacterium]|nr:aminotransferase class I/II-fold pyridoxal phosphate-dependent enzyme [Legionellales bacterium]